MNGAAEQPDFADGGYIEPAGSRVDDDTIPAVLDRGCFPAGLVEHYGEDLLERINNVAVTGEPEPYDDGGDLPPGTCLVIPDRTETVLTRQQLDELREEGNAGCTPT